MANFNLCNTGAGNQQIPTQFDARTKWPSCYTAKKIPEQGNCTASWAVSALSALTDRFCVADPASYAGLELSVLRARLFYPGNVTVKKLSKSCQAFLPTK